jgi:hypothetical protein
VENWYRAAVFQQLELNGGIADIIEEDIGNSDDKNNKT